MSLARSVSCFSPAAPSPQVVALSSWCLLRDSIYYTLSVVALIVVSVCRAPRLFSPDHPSQLGATWDSSRWNRCIEAGALVTQNHSQFSGLACLSVWTCVTCLILKEMLGNVSLKALIRITPTEPMRRRSGVISSWMPSWYPHLPASPRPGSVSHPCALRTSWEVSDQSMV